MTHDLIRQLKTLRAITPDEAFVARTRISLIGETTAPTAMPWYIFFPRSVGAFAALALALLAASSLLTPPHLALSSSLDPASIARELASGVAIQIDELQYEQQSVHTVTQTIKEIATSDTRHLNRELITKELGGLVNEGGSTNEDSIEALLERISQ